MPTASQHLDIYKYNKKFYNNIREIENCENWKVIVIYYEALHLIDKAIIEYSEIQKSNGRLLNDYYEHPKNHEKRKSTLEMVSTLSQDIKDNYILLEKSSRRARYHFYSAGQKTIELAEQRLKKIESAVINSPA